MIKRVRSCTLTRFAETLGVGAVLLAFCACGSEAEPAVECGAEETFCFQSSELQLPFDNNPSVVLTGDINGDESADLIWNARTGTRNEVVVGLSNRDGTFRLVAYEHPVDPSEGWTGYGLHVADFNADNQDDLVWNLLEGPENRTYVALSNGDGTFRDLAGQSHPLQSWSNCDAQVADLDARNGDELVWSCRRDQTNVVFASLNDGTGELEFADNASHTVTGVDWMPYDFFTSDLTNDGRSDLLFNSTTERGNSSWSFLTTGDGLDDPFDSLLGNERPSRWASYSKFVGNITGDRTADDVVFTDVTPGRNDLPVHRDIGQGNGRFQSVDFQAAPDRWRETVQAGSTRVFLADVDQDGAHDLVYASAQGLGLTILVAIANGDTDGTFDFVARRRQEVVGEQTWTGLSSVVGDFNGDGRDDLAYSSLSGNHRLVVGLAQDL